MSEMSILYDNRAPVVSDKMFGELLDSLYGLLDDVSDPIKLKANITGLIHQIEDRIAGDWDTEEAGQEADLAMELATSYPPEFSLLIQQAQQQNQQ